MTIRQVSLWALVHALVQLRGGGGGGGEWGSGMVAFLIGSFPLGGLRLMNNHFIQL